MGRESLLEMKLQVIYHQNPCCPDGLITFQLLLALLTLMVLLLLTKHFKMKSLIASLVLSTLPPPEATAMRHNSGLLELPGLPTMEPTLKYHLNPEIQSFTPSLDNMYKNCEKFIKYFPGKNNPNKHNDWTKTMSLVKPDRPEKPKKVVCSYPITTMWSNVSGTMVICYALVRYVRPMTWYRGYKYSRNCTFYLFIFCDHYYRPLKICPLREHLQNYKIEDGGTDLELNLNKNWIYDTVNISWGDIQVLENQIPIKLPESVTVPLRHKIKNRRMMSFDWDVQYMVKHGPKWYNLTRTYRAKRKTVSFTSLDEIDEVETSSLCRKLTVKRKPIVKEVAV